MSHVAPEPPRRRRVDYLAGSALALVGIAVAIVAIVALHNPNGRQAARAADTSASTSHPATTSKPATKPASKPATKPTTPPGSLTPAGSSSSSAAGQVPLVVLNNTDVADLADTARARFEQGGWTVSSVGNLVNNILSTCAYYDPSDPANQQAALRLQQQFPAIKRVVPKFAELPTGPVVVVLTSDYS